jgi:6-phosphogluconolactonase
MKKQFAILLLVLFCSSLVAQNNSFNLLIGTYTKGCDSKGMYVYDFDSEILILKKCLKHKSKLSNCF